MSFRWSFVRVALASASFVIAVSCTKTSGSTQDSGVLAAQPTALAASTVGAASVNFCAGTEPFWNLDISKDKLSLVDHSGGLVSMTIENKGAKSAAGHLTEYVALYQGKSLEDSNRFMNVIIKREKCSDGMSDTDFPYSVHILSGSLLLSGCCRIK